MGKIGAFWLVRLGTVYDAWIAERKRCAREPFRVGEFVCLMRTATVCMLVEIDSIDGEQVRRLAASARGRSLSRRSPSDTRSATRTRASTSRGSS
jgi:hypothetical protein